MAEPRPFFVPIGERENQEATYATLAQFAQQAVPSFKRRVYALVWMYDGVEWTATVGESLRGVERRKGTSKGKKVIRERFRSDPATVLAIFEGQPFFVVTNLGFNGGPPGSGWANPLMAGFVKSVTYFDLPT